jgi:hypothetical protein
MWGRAHLKGKSEEITLRIPLQAKPTIYKEKGRGRCTKATLQVHRPSQGKETEKGNKIPMGSKVPIVYKVVQRLTKVGSYFKTIFVSESRFGVDFGRILRIVGVHRGSKGFVGTSPDITPPLRLIVPDESNAS